ncbi:MAG: NUDIX domain-containing protein [Candidatus Pacearchaeota archaeon]
MVEIHHKIAGIIIKDKKLLMARKYDEPHFIMPGGRVLEGEIPEQTLRRELKEELDVELVSMKFFKTYEAPHFKEKNKIVRMDTYFVEILGEPKATSEINEIKWIDSHYKEQGIKVASINQDFLIPELKKMSLID